MNYTIGNDKLKAVVSTFGAELQSLQLNQREYLWQGDEAFWPEHSPILFPFVGRLTNDSYILHGQTQHMTIHGFAKISEFSVFQHSDAQITLLLEDNEESRKSYPYSFALYVTYTIEDQRILIDYKVENRSDSTMYFGIGGHPGFNVPLEDGLNFTDYFLEFSQAHRPAKVGHTPTCYLSGIDPEFPLVDGRILPMEHSMFDDDAIVLKNVADSVTLRSNKSNHGVTVTYPDLPYLGLWHAPKTEAPYICIEPWTSLPSRQDVVEDFTYKPDLIRLHPAKEYGNRWWIDLY